MAKKKLLDRESFLKVAPSGYKKALLELPFGSIYIRELSTKTLLSFKNRQDEFKENEALAIDAIADIIIECAANADGTPMFTDDDKATVASMPLTTLTTILAAVLELSGVPASMLEEAMLEAKDNLKNAPTTSSPSGSPKS